MIVKVLENNKLIERGYIRLINDKVEMQIGDDADLFERVLGTTPADGIEYIEAVYDAFMFSTSIILVKEDIDNEWLRELGRIE